MLTFTSAVGKLNVRMLWHHHMLLQVISQSYCQVFVKSYNFVFEKSTRKDPPVKSDQNKAISVHVLWVSFHRRSTPVLSSSHQKTYFLTHTRVSSAARAACPNPTCGPPLAGACALHQSATRTSFQSSQLAKFLEIVNNRRLFCRVVELPYIVDFFIKM